MIKKALHFVIRSFFVLVDLFLNVFPFLGSPFQTISMRLSFALYCEFVEPRWAWLKSLEKFVDGLFWNPLWKIEKNHVYNSYEAEEAKNFELIKLYRVKEAENFKLLLESIDDLTLMGRKVR